MKNKYPQKFYISTALLTILCYLMVSCGEEKLPPLSPTDTILAFGDSLTLGYGVAQKDSYPAILQALTGMTVVNAGISGETTAEGLLRFEQILKSEKPSLIILLEGGNDIIQNISSTKSKKNLEEMINLAQQFGAEVVLVGVPEKNLFSSAHPMYRELAEEHNLILIEDVISRLLKKSKYKSDSVHFNAAGYKVLAETIYKILQDNGAL